MQPLQVLENALTLVLNADYRPLSYHPLSLMPWKDVVKDVINDRFDVVSEYDVVARSPSVEMRIPAVIRHRDFVRPMKRVALTRLNLAIRDGYRCRYCSQRLRTNEITWDHVVPRAAGGLTSWDNVVVSCVSCNNKKSDLPLAKCGMTLLSKPYEPTPGKLYELGRKLPPIRVESEWNDWLYWTGELES